MTQSRARVLFVDDEISFLETLVKRMTKRGVNVHGVGSGQAALDYMASHAVDVVVLDVRMPGMDGLEVLKHIKDKWPLAEVILLTGHACVSSAMDFMALGAFDYMMKPVELQRLIFKIEDAYDKVMLKQKKQKQGGREPKPHPYAQP
ncbi:MAG: response regulator [Desulfobacter sp.]